MRRLALHLLHAHAALQVVDEALEEGEEVLRPPDVARHLQRQSNMDFNRSYGQLSSLV